MIELCGRGVLSSMREQNNKPKKEKKNLVGKKKGTYLDVVRK